MMRGVGGLPADIREIEAGESSAKSESAGASSSAQVAAADADKALRAPLALPEAVTLCLAGCHSLVFLDGQLVGDPMVSHFTITLILII